MTSNPQTVTDARGVPMSYCQPKSLELYEVALKQFHSYFGDPTVTLAAALEEDPDFVMGHIFNANAMMMMSERALLPSVRDSIEKAESLAHKSNWREKALASAARDWMEGRLDKASTTWDKVLAVYPHDALAVQCGHLTDFFLGDAVNLRDRIGRVIGHWSPQVPGYSYLLSMQAFGFEECNQFERAEETARAALEIEPRDGWGVHAVTHVMEMQNRYEEGKTFLRSRTNDWAPDNGFAFHNWWHLALFHVEHGDFDGALALYDQQIMPEPSTVSLQMLDASAMLWRLHLQGVDAGERWARLADMWAAKTPIENGYYAFNDLHAVIALSAAGRLDEARAILGDVKLAAASNPELTRMMARDVGIPTCSAMIAFSEGRYADVVETLLPVRTIANRFGGSNAQRDILSQTLIESAIRSGEKSLASNLINERSVHKPFSPLTQRYRSRAEMR